MNNCEEQLPKVKAHDKTVGILGGVGSESTARFFLKLIKNTPAKTDQDHLRIFIDNNPNIPDRTQAILGLGVSPVEEANKSIEVLENAGAEIIAIPCNTMHYFYPELQASTKVPIINMITETASYIQKAFPDMKKIGLLATTGTIMTRLYHDAINGIELITPNEELQEKVMNSIYGEEGIKAGYTEGHPRDDILEVIEVLIEKGAEAIILGCTELTLLSLKEDVPVPLVDPSLVLAEVVVKKARLQI
ncbi:aspartate/glutamate racemase family protein [Methanococcoides methylutens]|uniref:Aspartate racemase n=1 Tax=Methanococcoides methylutens MM1 TaxID=1434104 RepID=A0A0E3X1H8_METMT|nr:amino acid racemase [Methanococcoides methylutens]AKB85259.1 Aspartate racemase [Methanococcoides methylutens MM1]